MREEFTKAGPDAVIARIAARQHGVVSRAQLEWAGVLRQSVTRRVHSGRLHRVHRGVYAVGHTGLSREGRWVAAVLASGVDAVLSHTSAAELWGMVRSRRRSPAGSSSVVHVTLPGEGKSRRGIKVHRSRTLARKQVTRRFGIPVTTPSRTLQDLRRTLPERQFAAARREAEFLRLPIDAELESDGTRSEMETVFLGLCRRHRLPQPRVNPRIERFDVDFLWPQRRLVAEVDGWDTHRNRTAFEEDRARDVILKLAGYEVVRFTWRQLTSEPGAVAATLRALLKREGRHVTAP